MSFCNATAGIGGSFRTDRIERTNGVWTQDGQTGMEVEISGYLDMILLPILDA